MLRQNMLKNCPVTYEDVNLATKVFGKDGSIVKGKDVKPKLPIVSKEDVLELPPELQIKETELAINVMYVEDQAFFHSMDRRVQGEQLIPLGTMKKATNDQLLDSLRKVVHFYQRAGITITLTRPVAVQSLQRS